MDNWERAKYYNEQMEQIRQEKAQKLVEFQREVRIRVKRAEEQKQEAMLAKTYREVGQTFILTININVRGIFIWIHYGQVRLACIGAPKNRRNF